MSLSEPHTSVTALQDTCMCMSVCLFACGHIPKIEIERTETKVRTDFKFAHVLKLL